jgi:hypothetical protein
MASYIAQLALGVRCTLEPLEVSLQSPEGVVNLIRNLGWDGPIDAAGLAQIQGVFAAEHNLFLNIQNLANQIEAGAADELTVAKTLIDSLKNLIGLIQGLSNTPPGGMPAPLNQAAFWNEVPGALVDFLLLRFLEVQWAPVFATLVALGLAEVKKVTPAGAGRTPYLRETMHWDALPDLITNPEAHIQKIYHWNDGNPFEFQQLLENLGRILTALGAPTRLAPPRQSLVNRYYGAGNPALAQLQELEIPLMAVPAADPLNYAELGILVFPVTPKGNTGQAPDGFLITPMATGTIASGTGAGAPYRFDVKGGFETDGAFGIEVRPDSVDLEIAPGPTNMDAQFSFTGTPPQPWILIGSPGSHRLEAGGVFAAISLKGPVSAPEVVLELGTGPQAENNLAIVIQASDADSFLQSVIGSEPQRLTFGGKLTWSSVSGFRFSGGAAVEITLSVHIDLGVVNITMITLGLSLSGGKASLLVALTGGVNLGPIAATVDKIGVKLLMVPAPAGSPGSLGGLDFSFGFKPPSGLGIAIDAGVVAGGGYISFDPDKGQYAGVLDVSLAEIVQVKIIGVLDTILPDGSLGFSFLLIITFDFPPIQLGFGFTLSGVGGLGGVNRTMNTDALHTGFRAHTLNSVLFPPDPIANAPQIISNIENFFPPAEGRYLFGPMLELGWGTPTLITLAVGVILEVPDPVRLALLGLIDAGLPSTEAALIELHIDVLGILDFGTKTLSIDGSLYDSRVLIFSLAGDLALRLSWGDNPNFLFSLGGFNPHFNTTGLNVPNLHRLTVSIGNGDNPRISANSYFAITSNSLQFGSNVEAYASAAGFTIHGYLGFDVLIIYSPFSFEFDFSAGFEVSFEGVSLLGLNVDGTFSGPRPWHLHGDASIHILFFTVSASLDLTWGDSTPAILPQKPVLPDLLPAFQDPRNWSTALPDGTTQAVTLSTPKPDDKTLRVHPMGTLSVRENVVPLDLPITRYGNATPSDGNYFSISDVQIDGHDETKQNFQDYFAAGQFLTLSDADKISRPSFERYDAGIKIGSADIVSGADSPRTVFYEERYIDEPTGFSRFSRRYTMLADVHLALTRQGAGFASPLKNTGLFKYGTGAPGPAVTTQDPSYVVANVEDLSVRSDIVSSSGSTYFKARAALDSYLALHLEESNNLQIIPLHEVAA